LACKVGDIITMVRFRKNKFATEKEQKYIGGLMGTLIAPYIMTVHKQQAL